MTWCCRYSIHIPLALTPCLRAFSGYRSQGQELKGKLFVWQCSSGNGKVRQGREEHRDRCITREVMTHSCNHSYKTSRRCSLSWRSSLPCLTFPLPGLHCHTSGLSLNPVGDCSLVPVGTWEVGCRAHTRNEEVDVYPQLPSAIG